MDEALRRLAEIHGMGIGVVIGIPGDPPAKQEPLTCDICGYTDDTVAHTAVQLEEDNVIRCKKCSGAWELEKQYGTLSPRKRKKVRK